MNKAMGPATEENVIIRAASYLSGKTGEELEKEFEKNLKLGKRRFIVDFQDTEIINSIGVSILIGIIEKIMEDKGSIRFSNLSKVNEEIFMMMGLLRYAPLVRSEG